MKFRQMLEKDAREVYEMNYETWGNGFSKNLFFEDSKAEEKDGGIRYVLVENNSVVSSLIVKPYLLNDFPNSFVIESLVTHKKHRNKGYATILLDELIHEYKEKYPDVILFLYSDIQPNFYTKHDFKILPDALQDDKNSPLMVFCHPKSFYKISCFNKMNLPKY
jgi:ribosomal protein S18 acetylase RimI-like enzyme